MSGYTVTIHRKDGSIKVKPCTSELNAYAWVRMAQNAKWRWAYIAPANQTHAVVKVHDEGWSDTANYCAKITPKLAKG